MKSVWAVIPARAGSQGLPGKNILPLAGKPMINWSIEAALASEVCDRVFVSTNSTRIAAVARTAGAEVPYLRSEELSSSVAPTDRVMLDFLSHFRVAEHPEALIILQPTSPLRSRRHIQQALALYHDNDATSLMSVAPSLQSPYWTKVVRGGFLMPFLDSEVQPRRQDLPLTYYPNGAIYIVSVAHLLESGHIVTDRCLPLIMSPSESVDIDTEQDFRLAELNLLSRTPGGGRHVTRS